MSSEVESSAGESEDHPGPAKRPSNYRQEWKPWGMSSSQRGPKFAHCDLCGVHVSVSHGGVNDVKKHIGTVKHKAMQKASDENRSLGAFFPSSAAAFNMSVIRSEVLFANFLAKHNLPDHYTHLACVMFPDSKIAQNFSSARTKTISIFY
jgi:hypothetical protein